VQHLEITHKDILLLTTTKGNPHELHASCHCRKNSALYTTLQRQTINDSDRGNYETRHEHNSRELRRNTDKMYGDRSPDAAWIELSRWRSLSAEQRQKFPSIAPDFAIELRSRSDSLKTLQQMMQEYI